MRLFLFVLNNILVFLLGWRFCQTAMKDRPVSVRALAAAAMFPVIILLLVMLSGLAGALNVHWMTVTLCAAFVTTMVVRFLRRSSQSEAITKQFFGEKSTSLPGTLLLGAAAGVIIGGVLLAGLRYCNDDMSYHAASVAHWYKEQYLGLRPLNLHAYYPLNAEVFSLWFLIPFGSDGLAGLAGFYWIIVTLFAVASVGFFWRYSKPAMLLALLLIPASAVVKDISRTFSAVDIAGPAMLLAGAAMLIISSGREKAYPEIILAGLFAGFSAGAKVTFVPVCILIFIWLFFSGRSCRGVSTRAKHAALFACGLFITGSFWYVRNYYLTGNPVFPAQMGPLAGPLSGERLGQTTVISWIAGAPFDIKQWQVIIQGLVSWPPLMFMLCAGGYVYAFVFLVRKGDSETPISKNSVLLLVTVGIVIFIQHFFTPFSATDMGSPESLRIQPRFLIAPFIIGQMLWSIACARASNSKVWYFVTVMAMILPLGIGVLDSCLVNVGLCLAGFGFIFTVKKEQPLFIRLAEKTSLLWFLISMLAVVGLCFPYIQGKNDRQILARITGSGVSPAAWEYLNSLPDSSAITWFGENSYQYYPLFGRRLQYEPVILTDAGVAVEPLHRTWLKKQKDSEPEEPEQNDGAQSGFIENLKKMRVQYVMVSSRDGVEWPGQKNNLDNCAEAHSVYEDPHVVMWRID